MFTSLQANTHCLTPDIWLADYTVFWSDGISFLTNNVCHRDIIMEIRTLGSAMIKIMICWPCRHGAYCGCWNITWWHIMTSSNENIFRVTGPLCGEFTGDRWIPLKKASDAELWCFLWSAPEQTVERTIEAPVFWDAIALIMTSLWWIIKDRAQSMN